MPPRSLEKASESKWFLESWRVYYIVLKYKDKKREDISDLLGSESMNMQEGICRGADVMQRAMLEHVWAVRVRGHWDEEQEKQFLSLMKSLEFVHWACSAFVWFVKYGNSLSQISILFF